VPRTSHPIVGQIGVMKVVVRRESAASQHSLTCEASAAELIYGGGIEAVESAPEHVSAEKSE